MNSDTPKCTARTASGTACRMTPLATDPASKCWNHSELVTPEARAAAAKRGSLSTVRKKLVVAKAELVETTNAEDLPSLDSPASVRRFLQEVARRVATNQLGPAQAQALAVVAKLSL